MISALPCEQSVSAFQQWSNDTRGTDLEVDGISGPKTRKALIEAYMALDETTLPKEIEAVVHGCGEFFPMKNEKDKGGADNVEAEENRRVEMFCFHDEIQPPVPGQKATKGEPEYPQWQKQVTDEIDVTTTPSQEVNVRLLDRDHEPMAHVPWRAFFGEERRGDADGDAIGSMHVPVGVTEMVVEWGKPDDPDDGEFEYRQIIVIPKDTSDDDCLRRLQNLGLRAELEALSDAVNRYQRTFSRDETGALDDIRSELVSWHDEGASPGAA